MKRSINIPPAATPNEREIVRLVNQALRRGIPVVTAPILEQQTAAAAEKGTNDAWPIGSVFSSIVDIDPSIQLGVGTWKRYAEGKMLLGYDSTDPDANVIEGINGRKEYETHEGLVALWHMEEDAGTDRLDSTSFGNDLAEDNGSIPREGTIYQQGSYSVGPFTTSFLTRPDANLGDGFPGKNGSTYTGMSLGFWMYATTAGAATRQILTKGSGSLEAWWDNTPRVTVYLGGRQQVLNGATVDTWHHIAMTYDGTTLIGYIDGVASAGVAGVGAWKTANELVLGGFDLATHSYPFTGYLDEVFAYHRALSADEVFAIYQDGFWIESLPTVTVCMWVRVA